MTMVGQAFQLPFKSVPFRNISQNTDICILLMIQCVMLCEQFKELILACEKENCSAHH